MKKLFTILAVALALVSTWSCKKSSKDVDEGPDYSVLLVFDRSSSTMALFNVTLKSKSAVIEKGILRAGEGMIPSLDDIQTEVIIVLPDGNEFSVLLTDLLPGETYTARAFMTVDMDGSPQTFYSNTVEFQTLPDDV
ncbi:MAG: hypothetical protein IK045_07325 [Bacteroidales bacterium]|nr:hypothetical protein [Bacteroidales bacterium]